MTASVATFARHESFYPRVGWLWKAVNQSDAIPDVFLREDATVELGVGKNMVRAIRYWATATRVIEEYPDPQRPRRNLARPTAFGRLLFGADGWDPYLDDPRTLWLLHWILCRPPSEASAWQLLFGLWSRGDFTESEALAWFRERVAREPGWPRVSDESLRRDIQCILQMYAPPRRHSRIEDLVESPFRDLLLIGGDPRDQARWRFTYGPKPGLTPAIVAFACLDYVSRESSASTITLSRLALEPYSPGFVLRLTEAQISIALEAVTATEPNLHVVTPVGVRQLAFDRSPDELALAVLARDFGRARPHDRLVDLVGGGQDLGVAS